MRIQTFSFETPFLSGQQPIHTGTQLEPNASSLKGGDERREGERHLLISLAQK